MISLFIEKKMIKAYLENWKWFVYTFIFHISKLPQKLKLWLHFSKRESESGLLVEKKNQSDLGIKRDKEVEKRFDGNYLIEWWKT